MTRRLLTVLAGAALLLGLCIPLTQCFSPSLPDCPYRCGPEEPLCPDDYECREDRYCHKVGTTAACPFTMDLMPRPDMFVPGDLAPASDAGDGGD